MDSSVVVGFDRIAPYYERLLNFSIGRWVEQSQIYFVDQYLVNKEILIYGGGSGKLLRFIEDNINVKKVYYVDFSPKMIELSKQRISDSFQQKIEFICSDYTRIPKEISVDVIMAPYVLDCMTQDQVKETVLVLNNLLRKDGFWLFSDFYKKDTFLFRSMMKLIHLFFRITCNLKLTELPDFKSVFENSGLAEVEAKYFMNGFIVAQKLRKA